VSLAAEPGSHTVVIGPNGAGKSTLLRALLGLVQMERGETLVDGRPVGDWPRRDLARRVGLVSAREDFAFPLRVREYVAMGRHPHLGAWSAFRPEDRAALERALVICELEDLQRRPVGHLSAGELQRVRIARAITQEASALLLDEPTAHLDFGHEMDVFELIRQLIDTEGITVISVTHGLNLASRFADRVALMAGGRLVAEGPPGAVLRPGPLEHAFGRRVHVEELPGLGVLAVPLRAREISGPGGVA
jgi:iron complex transport system ATP-binding protein